MPTTDDPSGAGISAEAETPDGSRGNLLSFPDVGMRSNRKADSQRVALAREMFEERRIRPQIFNDSSMFGEGAWDILLALFVAEHSQDYAISAQSLLASEAPVSTTQRWVSYLRSVGFVSPSTEGAPLTTESLRLLPKARAMLNTYFDAVRQRHAEGERS